jgi:hypothetical protein
MGSERSSYPNTDFGGPKTERANKKFFDQVLRLRYRSQAETRRREMDSPTARRSTLPSVLLGGLPCRISTSRLTLSSPLDAPPPDGHQRL